MEARASFGRTGISKSFIAALVVLVVLGLGVMAAAVAKNVSGSTTTQTHAVKAQPASGPTYAQPGYRGGKQTLDDGLAPAGTSVAPRRSNNDFGPIE
jgi:opacity protein-like surface antigen